MQSKRFQKRTEDFICGHCGARTKGQGYTDHCPKCLWSRHVDINPGDRQSDCGGLMEPVGAEAKDGGYVIHYRCLKCGFKHRVKAASDDNLDEMLKIINQPIE
ncbi:MAG: hypothetical protein AUJ11_01815 [Parcubacteria group bacterium CG1_02_44_65]|uniref:RNHCP domain-containing protein n=3 Tax=Candidatus Portnoyibacteriota TaxID=1817913 RepID=A0A2M7YM53_9BACT|nr:MAG: hypothetical protein AUJ11_01815 [Parcubacteria group bacterium CG1_02_44_65]PIP15780.1 MAG: hypothetical protein COX45_01220 [Candidatus Portnoybacteria bacterium CG23_combo_of_CG06-09_8_20_14_all_44_36]PIZ69994.1 MAG: hypothetical protein COY10_00495 [Candidatus Portnoybacteria bacterium CG_4_10_14_0_2_um_filter_43_36]PJA64002.1 MAG: hypothetical protein CO160_00945 [Candidatus Portnoybacteria bacterium CG_4_9_14_3_um_filter_43_11]PJE59296.1 MAG: hypothetical protein COU84_01600 [Cand